MPASEDDDRSSVSWRRQALLWPAVCSLVAVLGFGLFLALSGLFASSAESLGLLVWVPIAVVVSVVAFGGLAIVIALTVRTLVRALAPSAPVIVRTAVLALVTGVGETTVTMLVIGAVGGDTGTSTWWFASGIGGVASLAAAFYARDLFAEVPEPFDWNRRV
ncbi:hypothetical protein HQ325_16520 [Rhodococcus sp. BP-349]|uniref:hypothetical protein n=1 Tax=unclassified Rhodococcus (in: high G+C Gram-positive bacteria) TaxID=192944 RepID=UPI001C9A34C8|nr:MULTISPECIES: hypothetical protein [unclassified Rhodococcus (in: high G+C Gram-positive bacteria)]MBY6540280.1 hypothetical protein [Rhodococcus sp. BP-363]MBY6545695.1 hypothetical protein [Rhodococcus sp. BP-369]MBY6564925.1 hypothetical protein [Rhodococcus sp. BP-370]MBY6578139.1 hypothetical protein [Rhodococcus sp. BP-364]MBY6587440.1 hypothetical protein [Rhodococcus sp. BP-358]